MVFLWTCLRSVPLLILIVVVALCWRPRSVSFMVNTQLHAHDYVNPQLLQSCPSPKFSNSSLPSVALASIQGSGNTWFRHLLQRMTGILTGAIYNDGALKRNGFPGEGKTDGTVIVIKTHANFSSTSTYKKVILLARNPFETFLAEFSRLASRSHVGRVDMSRVKTNWRTAVSRMIKLYRSFYVSWLNHKDILVIFYDKLKSNLRKELTRAKVFLEDENIRVNIECAVVDSEGNFHRNKTDSPLDLLYNPEERAQINGLIDEMHGKFCQRLNETCDNMLKWKLL